MNNEIICPHCKKTFKVDDTAFADILRQVRDSEFKSELHARIEDAVKLAVSEVKSEAKEDISKKEAEIGKLKAEKENAVQLATTNIRSELQADISKRDNEITSLRADLREKDNKIKLVESQAKSQLKEELFKCNEEIALLQQKLKSKEEEKESAISKAVYSIEKERDELIAKLKEKDNEILLVESRTKNYFLEVLYKKEDKIV